MTGGRLEPSQGPQDDRCPEVDGQTRPGGSLDALVGALNFQGDRAAGQVDP